MRNIKRVLKVVSAIALSAVIAVSGIGMEKVTAYAAAKQPLKVTFCGKTATLENDLYEPWSTHKPVKVTAVEKKWGKPSKKEKVDYEGKVAYDYVWKKGKSSISINNYTGRALGDVGSVAIEIKDKNASIYGVKVGMTKAAALKKLKKAVGKKKVIVLKEGQEPKSEMDEEGSTVSFTGSTGKAASDNEVIFVAMGPYYPMTVTLTKSGKVSGINFFHS